MSREVYREPGIIGGQGATDQETDDIGCSCLGAILIIAAGAAAALFLLWAFAGTPR